MEAKKPEKLKELRGTLSESEIQIVSDPNTETNPYEVSPAVLDYFRACSEEGICPTCGWTHFLEGPEGGNAQNIFCGNPECGAGFNAGSGGIIIQKIGDRKNILDSLGVEQILASTKPLSEIFRR